VLYLNSLLATTHGIIIDHAFGAPGHGKDKVDSPNTLDKQFIAENMALIVTPEANESSNQMHTEAILFDGAAASCQHEYHRRGCAYVQT
jgi:hypothetical protein